MTPPDSAGTRALTCVLDIKASLGECPLWSTAEQALYWVDINAPSLNRFDPSTGRNTVMPMPESIGCFALRARGGFVVALRGGVWLARPDGTLERRVAEPPYDLAHHRFNDGRCDRQGRFLAGTMNERRDASTGALIRIDPDFRVTRVLGDMTISNGLAWSPDGRTMYHADTPTRTIARTTTTPRPERRRNRRVFARFAARPTGPTAARSTARLLLDRVLSRRQGSAHLASRATCWPTYRDACACVRRCARSAAPIWGRST